MKFKLTVLLATFVVMMGLLLGASTTQAADVITDGAGNVTRIENLPVLDEDTEEPTIYNVDFVYDSAINVYATGEFDFPEDQDALLALEAVTDALNAEDTVPPGTGPQGTDQFFIGNTEREGFVIALGGQNQEGVWNQCGQPDCLAGVGVLSPSDSLPMRSSPRRKTCHLDQPP